MMMKRDDDDDLSRKEESHKGFPNEINTYVMLWCCKRTGTLHRPHGDSCNKMFYPQPFSADLYTCK